MVYIFCGCLDHLLSCVLALFLSASSFDELIKVSWFSTSSFWFPFLDTDALRSLLPANAYCTMSCNLLSPSYFNGFVPLVPVTSSPVSQKVSNDASAKIFLVSAFSIFAHFFTWYTFCIIISSMTVPFSSFHPLDPLPGDQSA